jgi:hypothetical protein
MKTSDSYSETDILNIAEEEHKHHPKAILRDYYKLFFQACWGQGHFISDNSAARTYIEQELIIVEKPYLPLIQDISHGKGLYRVSLCAISEGLISIEEYLSLFLAKKHIEIAWTDWTLSWHEILIILIHTYPELNDAVELNFCLYAIEKQALISHSEYFRLTYRPHYRVMQLSDADMSIFIK